MGGRGKWSYTRAHMIRYKYAVIARSRISNYLLNPSKSKGKEKFLRGLGYNMKNQKRLQEDLRKGLQENKARYSEPNKYGTVHIQVNMEIGVSKRSKVVTGWILRKGSNKPELSTVRPYKEKDKF